MHIPQAIAIEVCEWVASGRTLRSYCRQPGKPARRTIDDWRAFDSAFRAAMERARDDGFAEIAEEVMQIADSPLMGEATEEVQEMDEDGHAVRSRSRKVKREEMLGHRKLQCDVRLKLLACWDPRKYGNKVQVGGDGGEPIKVSDKDAAAKEIASILATAASRATSGDAGSAE